MIAVFYQKKVLKEGLERLFVVLLHIILQGIWSRFLANRSSLERLYSQLPVSVFQADLNPGNILLDADMRFAGVLDFNLSGRDTALNVLFRELWINFDEDDPVSAHEGDATRRAADTGRAAARLSFPPKHYREDALRHHAAHQWRDPD